MIDLAIASGVAEIALPEAHLLSRGDLAAAAALTDAIHACDDRDDVKVVILHNDGGDFCGQTAIPAPTGNVWTGWQRHFAGPDGLYQSLCFSRKVTLTAVDGLCAGAGAMLVLCSDITIANAGARFASPFRHLPESSLVLAALTIGLNRAKAWALTDGEFVAEAAQASGLVNLVTAEPALEAARRAARSIVRQPLDGLAMSKLLVEGCLDTQGVAQEFDAAALAAAARQTLDSTVP